jgi:hypothetical protein
MGARAEDSVLALRETSHEPDARSEGASLNASRNAGTATLLRLDVDGKQWSGLVVFRVRRP